MHFRVIYNTQVLIAVDSVLNHVYLINHDCEGDEAKRHKYRCRSRVRKELIQADYRYQICPNEQNSHDKSSFDYCCDSPPSVVPKDQVEDD
jgi:hypothetical protein